MMIEEAEAAVVVDMVAAAEVVDMTAVGLLHPTMVAVEGAATLVRVLARILLVSIQ